MKYPIGTVLFAPMMRSKIPNDNVRGHITGFDGTHYKVNLKYELKGHKDFTERYDEAELDKWLNDGWIIERREPQLPEDLFTL